MDTNDLAEQAKRTWGATDAVAANRFLKLVAKDNVVQNTHSDVPETQSLDGQPPW